MSVAKLSINSQKEFEVSKDLITIGRATDNDVSFFQDSNVSRNHAEIQQKGENEFWLADLNSSNGTTLNGNRVHGEKPLYDGDIIVLGGTSEIKFLISEVEDIEEEENLEEKSETIKAPIAEPKKSSISLLLVLSGLAVGLAVICVFAAGFFYFYKSDNTTTAGGCQARAKILSPQNGDILKQKATIEIALQDGDCVSKVSYLMDGETFATSESNPFSATLDPAQFPDLAADGLDHKLTVVLEDADGSKMLQPGEIALALETVRTKKREVPDETIVETDPQTNPPPTNQTSDSQMSLIDVKKMTTKVLPQFAGSFEYKANNQNFLSAVRRMQAEYISEGYFERATKYRDVIAKEYIQNRNLDEPLGFILAMSRTKFLPTNQANGAGLWKMDNKLVLENNYNGSCESETIAAPTQKCAAIASSIYLKDIVRDVFEGDIIYGIAAFGMSKNEAAAWKATLPPPSKRKDFWNVIKSKKQRDEIVRFFAAATVAENPQKFGLEKDKPLSELYRPFM